MLYYRYKNKEPLNPDKDSFELESWRAPCGSSSANIPGVLGFQALGFQGFRVSGFQGFRVSGFWSV